MGKAGIAKISACTGISIVVANMIGSGAFTSLGFQVGELHHTLSILSLWILGGVLALAGAFSYAEVGTAIKRSGGEYAFLSHIYHPLVGYLSGWISLTVGFAAPVALSTLAFMEYLPVKVAHPAPAGILLIAALTLVHSYSLRSSARFQNVSTLLKVLLIVALIAAGLVVPQAPDSALSFHASYLSEITSAAFAVSLIYVSYSYSGWNAAAYITEEFRNPVRALPVALIGGTLIVTLLYTLLQYVFLKHVSPAGLTGAINVGTPAVEHILGADPAKLMGAAISLLLISGISAMTWVGPRVTAGIAREHYLWRRFTVNDRGIPVKALWLQFAISALLLLTGTFEQIMVYCGILLTLSTLLVVAGVFILRRRQQREADYKSPLFPLFQIFFIGVSLWMIVFALIHNPYETLIGLSNLVVGVITYFTSRRMQPPTKVQNTHL
ncbi:MAG: amino acid permease [Tannerellaceae bacterium]|jgi:APA family basic amino acid/polyamine antiporter|nr:amino acid permease [Tannerellaceae bacterium]